MDVRIAWVGRVLVAMTPCAMLVCVRAVSAQGEPSGATSHPLSGGRESPARFTLEGFVLAPDGSPAAGAIVASSAGGKAITDADGCYRLDVEVPLEATNVQLTAVGSSRGGQTASTSVALIGQTRSTRVNPLTLSLGSSCSPGWLPTFGEAPGIGGDEPDVQALAVHDDGSGPALYVGGNFDVAGASSANRIARWNGRWEALGSDVNDDVHALAVHDDGGGPALYAGGSFTTAGGVTANAVAKWNGSSWAALQDGLAGDVFALVAFDDGSGSALYAAGSFTLTGGGLTVNHVAKWDGSSWTALGGGTDDVVRALAVHDDGGGPALYAGGGFTTAGGVAASRIARWNGASWSPLGSGTNGPGVHALTVYDDGSGPDLYAGGEFTTAGGVAANRVARWNGSGWSALGAGMSEGNTVLALAVYDGGAGPTLHAAGGDSISIVHSGYLATWNGSNWSFSGDMSGPVNTLAVYDDGDGSALYSGGDFIQAGATFVDRFVVNRIAKWDASSWAPLGSGFGNPNGSPSALALAVHDDGGGPALFAGGGFTGAGGVALKNIAKRDGTTWAPVGGGVNLGVSALAVHDDGGGPELFAGGGFTIAGGSSANRIAKWDGSSWASLGSGMNAPVHALAVFDDGGGPALYAGGEFTSAGGVTANRIAKWNGTSWTTLGTGMNTAVRALTAFDDGGGPALFAGGNFRTADGITVNHIARWDGSSWSALGSGIGDYNINSPGTVYALAVHDDGGGPSLYAGGNFPTAGGSAATGIARWNGSSWSALGSGIEGFFPGDRGYVYALAVHDDGGGPALYAGGSFGLAGGIAVQSIAKWDGSSWSALGSGMGGTGVRALATFDDGTGPGLYAGGYFLSAIDSGDSYLAMWGCDTTPPVLSCPPSITVIDRFLDGPGEVVSYQVTATDVHDPEPVVVCVPPSGSTFPLGTTLVECTATDASGNESTCQFPVTVLPKARRR